MRNTTKRTLAMIICLTMMLTLQPAGVPTALAAAPEWTAVGGPGFSDGEAFCTSLAIAADGTLYVAYKGNDNKATVMKYSGTGWELVGSAGFSAGTTDYISLALAGGTPYVAYQDWGIDKKATVMKYNAGLTGWEEVGSPGFSAGYIDYTSLAIGSGGTLYVAYKDAANEDKATVMRYIPDTTAPVLTAGGVSRSSDSAATVSFNSDEEGQYYYAVVAEGAAAPALDTGGAGTACGAGDQTITLTSLSAGNWDIYIKVKDASGNVSNALTMTIPSLMAGIPNLTATADSARVHLSWTPVAASVSYSVYQSTISGTYGSALDSVASSVYSYDAVGLTNNVTYYFMVNALDSYGNTADSNEASATPRQHSGTSSGNDDVLSFTTEKAVQPEPEPEPEPEEKQMFSDVSDTHWAYASINQLCQKGAVSGYKDGSFRPDDPITRAEFITILVKALDLHATVTAQNFSDTANHWAQENIATAASLGIAGGYADGSFKPDELITREQMAVMAVKAAGVTAGFGETAFTDNEEISFWAKGSVLAAVDAGIMTGYPDNTFRPQGNATRAEAVCVILNLIK